MAFATDGITKKIVRELLHFWLQRISRLLLIRFLTDQTDFFDWQLEPKQTGFCDETKKIVSGSRIPANGTKPQNIAGKMKWKRDVLRVRVCVCPGVCEWEFLRES